MDAFKPNWLRITTGVLMGADSSRLMMTGWRQGEFLCIFSLCESSPVPPACLSAGRSDPARCCWSGGSTGCETSSSAWPGGRQRCSHSPPASLLQIRCKHRLKVQNQKQIAMRTIPGWNATLSGKHTATVLDLAASMCEVTAWLSVKQSVGERTQRVP